MAIDTSGSSENREQEPRFDFEKFIDLVRLMEGSEKADKGLQMQIPKTKNREPNKIKNKAVIEGIGLCLTDIFMMQKGIDEVSSKWVRLFEGVSSTIVETSREEVVSLYNNVIVKYAKEPKSALYTEFCEAVLVLYEKVMKRIEKARDMGEFRKWEADRQRADTARRVDKAVGDAVELGSRGSKLQLDPGTIERLGLNRWDDRNEVFIPARDLEHEENRRKVIERKRKRTK